MVWLTRLLQQLVEGLACYVAESLQLAELRQSWRCCHSPSHSWAQELTHCPVVGKSSMRREAYDADIKRALQIGFSGSYKERRQVGNSLWGKARAWGGRQTSISSGYTVLSSTADSRRVAFRSALGWGGQAAVEVGEGGPEAMHRCHARLRLQCQAAAQAAAAHRSFAVEQVGGGEGQPAAGQVARRSGCLAWLRSHPSA